MQIDFVETVGNANEGVMRQCVQNQLKIMGKGKETVNSWSRFLKAGRLRVIFYRSR